MSASSDLFNASNINKAIGSAYSAVGAGTSVVNSVKSLFGGTVEETGGQNKSAINNLRSYLAKNDVLSNNLFYVNIRPPNMMVGDSNITKELSLLCHSASLPGISFGSSDIRRHGVGVTEKVPTFPIFTDLSLTFIGDGKGNVRNFFYNWMNNIVRFSDQASMDQKGQMAAFEISYKEQYATSIEIVVVNRANQEIFVTNIAEAFPLALGDQSLSWHDNDSLMAIPVTFTYRNWQAKSIKVGSIVAGQEPSPSLLNNLLRVGSAIQTLSTIKSPRSIGDIVNVTKNASSVVSGLKGLF